MGLTIEETLKRGIEAHKAGQFQDADRFFNSILEVQPRHPDANHNMGVLMVSVGQVEKALTFFGTALESNPGIAQYWHSHIDALVKLEEIDNARSMVVRAKEEGVEGEAFTKLEQSMVQLSKSGGRADSDNSNSTRSEINILDTKSLIQALRIAKRKTKEGFNEDAKRIFQNIIDRFPKNIRAIHGIKALSERVAADRVKNQNPGKIQLQVLQELSSKEQLQQVLIQAEQMLRQFPKSFVLYSVLGAAKAGLKSYDITISNYKQAFKINPGDADAYNNMGVSTPE